MKVLSKPGEIYREANSALKLLRANHSASSSPAAKVAATEVRAGLIDGIGATITAVADSREALAILRASSLKERQQWTVLIEALSNVTSMWSQVEAATASQTVGVLINMSSLATATQAPFDDAATLHAFEVMSNCLAIRGSTPPDSVIRSMPTLVDSIVACGENRVQVRSANVAVLSVAGTQFTNGATGIAIETSWTSVYPEEDSLAAGVDGVSGDSGGGSAGMDMGQGMGAGMGAGMGQGVGQDMGAGMEAGMGTNQGTAMAGMGGSSLTLDLPIRMRVDGYADAYGGLSTRTTFAQYAAARQPFWPSPNKSTDTVSLTISPLLAVNVGNGSRRLQDKFDDESIGTCTASTQRRLRRLAGAGVQLGGAAATRTAADLKAWINVSFAIRSRRFANGTEGVVRSDPVVYNTTDVCGKATSHTANTVLLPGGGRQTGGGQTMWCAWWDHDGWRTEGCTANNITNDTPNNVTEVHCTCRVLLPHLKTDESGQVSARAPLYHGDFGIVDYSFNRIAKSITASGIPFVPSVASLLTCGIPLVLFIILVAHSTFCRRKERLRTKTSNRTADRMTAQESSDDTTQRAISVGHKVVTALFGVRRGLDKPALLIRQELRQSILWWWWQAVKLHHDMVAPFLAPTSEERTRNYYLGIMLTKYATCVASGTLLYHMHCKVTASPPPRTPTLRTLHSSPVAPHLRL